MDFRVKKIRLLTSPDARLHALSEKADQAEAWAERLRARMQLLLERTFSLRRRLATVAVSLLAMWLFLHVMLGANGMVIYRGKRSEYQNLQKQIQQLE